MARSDWPNVSPIKLYTNFREKKFYDYPKFFLSSAAPALDQAYVLNSKEIIGVSGSFTRAAIEQANGVADIQLQYNKLSQFSIPSKTTSQQQKPQPACSSIRAKLR